MNADRIDIDKVKADIVESRNEYYSYFNYNKNLTYEVDVVHTETNQRLMLRALKYSNKRLNVIFMLPDVALWDVYESTYRAMKESEYFSPTVVFFERLGVRSSQEFAKSVLFMESMDIDFLALDDFELSSFDIEYMNPDFVFYTLGSIAYPSNIRIEYVSKFCLTCYFPYGFMLANEPDYQFGQSFHHHAWTVFASTGREKDLYDGMTKRVVPNTKQIQYPKFDLIDGGRDPSKLVVWAPHWTIGLIYPQLNLGLFHEICNFMYEVMRENSDMEFILKPHPNLRHACHETSFMNDESYNLYLDMIDSIENAAVYTGGANMKIFNKSAALITDSVSFLAEFLPTGKPTLFLDRPDRAALSGPGERIIASLYKGRAREEVEAFLENIRTGHDPLAGERKRTAEAELSLSRQPASTLIVEHLLVAAGRR